MTFSGEKFLVVFLETVSVVINAKRSFCIENPKHSGTTPRVFKDCCSGSSLRVGRNY